jgi:hypothetical protein
LLRGDQAVTNQSNFLHHVCPININIEEMKTYMEAWVYSTKYGRLPGLKSSGIIKAAGFGCFFATQDDRAENRTTGGETVAIESRR